MTAKVYVDVLAVFSREGELIPTAFVWEDGRKYAIDKVSKPERCASRKAGGTGYRYTCQVGGKICHLTYHWMIFDKCQPQRWLILSIQKRTFDIRIFHCLILKKYMSR